MKILKVLFVLIFWLTAISVKAQQGKISPETIGEGTLIGITKPLKDIPPVTAAEFEEMVAKAEEKLLNPKLRIRTFPYAETALPKGPDAVWQKYMGQNREALSDPIVNFQGQNSPYFPPDENGTAGPNHYMQTVNSTYAIYSKTGTLLAGPTNMNQLFGSVPGANCNDGDPIMLYDEMADRWMAAEFSLCGSPDRMLVAVSATNDPTGSWYQYSFNMTGMPDYEKFGIWPDGYYMGTNTSSGNDIYVFEREVMLAGGTNPKMVAFNNPWRPTSIDGFMMVPPLDNDGTAAPAGEPGLFIAFNDDAIGGGSDQLWIYELDVDWATTANSTFNRVQQIGVEAFDSNFGNNWNNIKQPNTSQELDGVPQVIMNAPQYRNFGDYQTIVCCHTVDVDASDHAGVRWYELRKTDGDWTVRQQGTYAPDEHSRWMGSVMMNGNNELGLGYSVSSTTVFPGIRFTGQTEEAYASASGIMDVPEGIIWEGASSQTGTMRWGDYSLLCVDPADDETFWYTNQYVSSGQKTRIASFVIGPAAPITSFTASNTLPCINEPVVFTDESTGEPTSWEWSFAPNTVVFMDGTSASSQNPVVQFTSLGSYDVTLNATNAIGSTAKTITAYINVNLTNANFSANLQSVVINNPVTLTDASTCEVSSWLWDFGNDASPATANTQGPHTVVYSSTGNKTITLTVNGTVTETKTNYINVINDVFVMNGSTVSTCSGTFLDPGGNNNYGNNRNFTMVFNASQPNRQLSVNFSSFALELSTDCANDYLKIYNGPSIFSPLLGTYCGTDSPGLVTSDNPTGTLTFVFKSNGSLNAAGWSASVMCMSQVANPASLLANAASDTQINLGWEKNPEANNVLLAWSADGNFGNPLPGTSYNTGDAIPGGGIVLYAGSETSFSHSGLMHSTPYYYKAFSTNAALDYSPGIEATATTNTAASTLSINPEVLTVENVAGLTSFSVTSNASWTVTTDADWITVTASGNGNGTVEVNYQTNELATERVAVIEVTVTGLDPVQLTLTQAAGLPLITVSPESIDVTNVAGSVVFDVISNATWTAVTEASWCNITSSGNGNGTITAEYQQNSSSPARTASIVVSVEGLDPVVVMLNQAAAEAYLAVEPVLIQVSAAAGIAQMIVYSNIDWTTGSDANWVSMPAGASGTAAIQITYEENQSLTARSAVITITGNNLSASATLEQAGVEATVSISPANATVDYLAGSVNFDVISNTAWTASADSTWLTVTPSGNLSGTLVATYLQNPYYADRMSTISISVAGREPLEVNLTQSNSEVSVEESDLQGIRIYPNPSKGIFVLEADPARYTSMDVQLTDLTGHVILSRICKGDNAYTFDLTNLTEGAYTMNIKTENNLITRKIVIIR